MTKINKKEYEILKGLDDRWKWIARDDNYDASLFCFENRPYKSMEIGAWGPNVVHYEYLGKHDSKFQFIQWEDEEPYNIVELIEEYEEHEFYDYVGWEYHKSEESEMKDIEWLKEEIWRQDIVMDKGYIYTDDLMSIINEVDEPEVLSQEWIEEKYFCVENWDEDLFKSDGDELFDHTPQIKVIALQDLQNLIAPKEELPVVPTWFDEWWKDVSKGSGSLFHNIDRFYDELFSSGTREMYNYISSPDNKQKLLNIIVNELDYVVEEEQKYIVKIGNLYLAEPLGDMTSDIVRMTRDKGVAYQFADEKSIATHLDKFEGTEVVKVEEHNKWK